MKRYRLVSWLRYKTVTRVPYRITSKLDDLRYGPLWPYAEGDSLTW